MVTQYGKAGNGVRIANVLIEIDPVTSQPRPDGPRLQVQVTPGRKIGETLDGDKMIPRIGGDTVSLCYSFKVAGLSMCAGFDPAESHAYRGQYTVSFEDDNVLTAHCKFRPDILEAADRILVQLENSNNDPAVIAVATKQILGLFTKAPLPFRMRMAIARHEWV